MIRLRAVMVKELRQIRGDPFSLGMLIVLPAFMLVLYGFALTFDVRYWDTDLTQKECAGISTRKNSCDARVVASVAFDTSWKALQELTGMGR